MSYSTTSISQCPACGKVVSFASQKTNVAICPVCWAPLLRTEGRVVLKSVAIIQDSKDLIQPGTTGEWKGNGFSVLGRARVWFDESVFNYWTIEWSNKEIGLLGEGYGLYSILSPIALPQQFKSESLQKLRTGSFIELIHGEEGLLEKKQKAIDLEIEGELLLMDDFLKLTVYDFASAWNWNISLFDFGKDNIMAYEVNYISGSSLQLNSIRTGEGSGKNFSCTQCYSPISVKTFPYSQSCACNQCGSYYSYTHNTGFKKNSNAATRETPCIMLGTTGEIDGIQYEVVGYTQKEERNNYRSKWREFTLYNKEWGFAFLSEYDGHWIYLKETCNSPVMGNDNEKDILFKNNLFKIFNSYTCEVINARGEFPYNIFDNKESKYLEFIAPPKIWIREKDSNEGIRWFAGQHISSKEIAKKFDAGVPYRIGIGAVQPGSIKLTNFYKAVFIGFLILLATYFVTTSGKQQKSLFTKNFSFSDSSNTVTFVTDKYLLDKRRSNLEISISAPVSNSWFELSATLVNATTGKEYTMEKGVEYYSGYSDGESWSEGSQRENAYFTRIPGGTYFLQLEGTRDGGGYRIPEFSVEVIYDVPNIRNLWISIILFLLWPVGKYLHIRYVEAERWRISPYSNYHEGD